MRLVEFKTNLNDYFSSRTGVDMSLKRIRGATIVVDLVFTSGMTGGTGDVETQIRTSLGKLEAALKEAGTHSRTL